MTPSLPIAITAVYLRWHGLSLLPSPDLRWHGLSLLPSPLCVRRGHLPYLFVRKQHRHIHHHYTRRCCVKWLVRKSFLLAPRPECSLAIPVGSFAHVSVSGLSSGSLSCVWRVLHAVSRVKGWSLWFEILSDGGLAFHAPVRYCQCLFFGDWRGP